MNNVSQGAVTEPVTDVYERNLLAQIAQSTAIVGAFDYVGVDIVKSLDNGKYYVLEANSAQGVYDVETDSGEDYVPLIIDSYEKLVLSGRKNTS